MKFDLFNWKEEYINVEIEVPKGKLRLRCSAPCPLYVKAHGVEALAGYDTAFDLDLSEAVAFRLQAPKGVRLFREVPPRSSFEPDGEVFTNIDRMPDESGTLAEVTRARRMFELEQRSALREMRAEMAELRAARAAVSPAAEPEEVAAVVEDEDDTE